MKKYTITINKDRTATIRNTETNVEVTGKVELYHRDSKFKAQINFKDEVAKLGCESKGVVQIPAEAFKSHKFESDLTNKRNSASAKFNEVFGF